MPSKIFSITFSRSKSKKKKKKPSSVSSSIPSPHYNPNIQHYYPPPGPSTEIKTHRQTNYQPPKVEDYNDDDDDEKSENKAPIRKMGSCRGGWGDNNNNNNNNTNKHYKPNTSGGWGMNRASGYDGWKQRNNDIWTGVPDTGAWGSGSMKQQPGQSYAGGWGGSDNNNNHSNGWDDALNEGCARVHGVGGWPGFTNNGNNNNGYRGTSYTGGWGGGGAPPASRGGGGGWNDDNTNDTGGWGSSAQKPAHGSYGGGWADSPNEGNNDTGGWGDGPAKISKSSSGTSTTHKHSSDTGGWGSDSKKATSSTPAKKSSWDEDDGWGYGMNWPSSQYSSDSDTGTAKPKKRNCGKCDNNEKCEPKHDDAAIHYALNSISGNPHLMQVESLQFKLAQAESSLSHVEQELKNEKEMHKVLKDEYGKLLEKKDKAREKALAVIMELEGW